MKVTVVLTTYNRPEMCLEAVDSVRAQTYPDVELIVVDDGSHPRFSGANVWMEHRGAASCLNVGCALAGGDAICHLDDDDLLTPHYVEACVAGLREGYDVAGMGTLDGSERSNNMDGGGIFRKEWFYRVGGFMLPGDLDFFLDWYFWLRIGALGATSCNIRDRLQGEKGHKIRKGHPRISDPYESDIGYYLKCRDRMLEVFYDWRMRNA